MSLKVLVTRRAKEAARTEQAMVAAGFEPVVMPLTALEPIPVQLHETDYGFVAFTSTAAIEAVDWAKFAHLFDLPVFAVGKRTAEVAEKAGFRQVAAGPGEGSGLADLIAERPGQDKSVRGLYPCGQKRSFDLQGALRRSGIEIDLTEVYRMRSIDPGRLAFNRAMESCRGGVQLHYSAESAARFLELVREFECEELSRSMVSVSISEKTSLAVDNALVKDNHFATMAAENSMIDIIHDLGLSASD